MQIDVGLAGKRALVTGAGQGVGKAIAMELARADCHVMVNDFYPERAESVAATICADGGRAAGLPFDVTDHAAVTAAISAGPPLEILVTNAGNAGPDSFGTVAAFVDTTPEQWRPFVDTNLYGAMNCVHAALPAMIGTGWGRIIGIVSDAGRVGGAGLAAYAAAKAGAAGFTRSIAHEVARHGITANVLALGTMRTPLTAALWEDPDLEPQRRAILADYLVRRPGDPADPAWLVLALASPRAGWVTGQTIPVNGGYSLAL